MACEHQSICGDLPETTAFQRYAAKHEGKTIMLITLVFPWSGFSARRTAKLPSGYPAIVNDIQPCPNRCSLIAPARVGVRTDSTTRTATARGMANFRTIGAEGFTL